ncbi:hypothetical protein LX32DRAFT_642772 [Colletotrichum zoysiae]|uniref:Uncharacterized protein n=1 Tax=Colletotrichum zoysiae TaxID=1216348 RepID=A0AAD9HCG6_9PEZI|nr:hypothetical protein LX32DRAFT_642772 [Colletotrichum zoysiae]
MHARRARTWLGTQHCEEWQKPPSLSQLLVRGRSGQARSARPSTTPSQLQHSPFDAPHFRVVCPPSPRAPGRVWPSQREKGTVWHGLPRPSPHRRGTKRLAGRTRQTAHWNWRTTFPDRDDDDDNGTSAKLPSLRRNAMEFQPRKATLVCQRHKSGSSRAFLSHVRDNCAIRIRSRPMPVLPPAVSGY